MPEKITPEDLLNNIVGLAENSSKQKSVPFFGDDKSDSVSSQLNRLFGRQKPVHHLLGGGKSADVLLWRNKKISASVLTGFVNRSSSKVPRLVLPEELFVNIAISIGAEINRGLEFIQDVACGGNLKQFLVVVASLWAASVIGSWCNFLTVLYIGFVAAHTLPVLYERYGDQIDDFVYSVFGQLQNHYRKLDSSVLSRIPKGNLKAKKHD
ncbi:PREDICTED: reticulon-like protein B8-like [Fragaria vesca subsp. vesca]